MGSGVWAWILFGAAAVLFGIAAALTWWAWRGRRRAEDRVRSTALDLRDRDRELTQALQERDAAREDLEALKGQWRAFLAFLVDQGVLSPDADPLTVSDKDLVYQVQSPVPNLPDVSLDELTLLEALRHAAAREGPRADRPFSRRYMVADGPLTRTEFESLRAAMVSGGYLVAVDPQDLRRGYRLTESGAALLEAAKQGNL
jgi:hypothetical protein